MAAESIISYPSPFTSLYRIEYKLGEGAYATVWQVFDFDRRKIIAMKMIVGEGYSRFIEEEQLNLTVLQEKIGKWTDCFPQVFDRGIVSESILKDYPDIPSQSTQRKIDMGFSGYDELNVSFFNFAILSLHS